MKREHVRECGPQHIAPTKDRDWRSCLRLRRDALNLLPIRTPCGSHHWFTVSTGFYRFPLHAFSTCSLFIFHSTQPQKFADPMYHAFSNGVVSLPFTWFRFVFSPPLPGYNISLSLRGSPGPVAGIVSVIWSERRRREKKRAFPLKENNRGGEKWRFQR